MSSKQTKAKVTSKDTNVSGNKRPPSAASKPRAKQSEKEKQLQEENKKLKDKIVMLECNYDPDKIKKSSGLSEETLVNLLTEENDRLKLLLNKYTSGDSKQSINDKELHDKLEKLEKEHKECPTVIMQKNTEISKLEERIKELTNKSNTARSTQNQTTKEQKESQLSKYDPGLLQEKTTEIETLKKTIEGHKETIEDQKKTIEDQEKTIDDLKKQLEDFTETKTKQKTAESKNDQRLLLENTAEMETLKKTIEELKKTIEEQKETVGEQKKTLEEQTKQLGEFTEMKKKLKTTEQSFDEKVNTLRSEKASIENEKKKLENECSSLRDKLKLKETQEENMKNSSTNAEKSTKSADEIQKKIDEITELKNKLTTVESEIESVKREKDSLEKKARDQNKKLESEINRLKEEKNKIIEENNKTINKLRKEMNESKHSGKKNAGTNDLQDKLKSAQDEIDELKNRLSKVVGANIMNDNPNITDLSDENRPTKLSEKFSELYDNEWTDAFEEAENEFKTEEKGIEHLYKTLLDVFDFCKKKSVEHAQNIRNCVMTLPNSPNARPKSAEIGITNQRQLKEIRKSFAPMLVESVFQNYLKEKKLNLSKKENIEKFIRKCVEICWLMNSQDPPVILDTTVVNGKSFDADKYRTYTKTGKVVEYVVWPPMLLHKDGPMLCKGVAQGK